MFHTFYTNLGVNPLSELYMDFLLYGFIYCIEPSLCICANNKPPDQWSIFSKVRASVLALQQHEANYSG